MWHLRQQEREQIQQHCQIACVVVSLFVSCELNDNRHEKANVDHRGRINKERVGDEPGRADRNIKVAAGVQLLVQLVKHSCQHL